MSNRIPTRRKAISRSPIVRSLVAETAGGPALELGGQGDAFLAFLRRVADVALQAASGLPRKEARGLEKASSSELLLRLAERSARNEDNPLARARVRGLEGRQRLEQTAGGLLDGREVARLLGMTPAGVHKRYQAHQLLGIRRGSRRIGYPSAQFHRGRVIPHLEEVLKVFAAARVDGWAQLAFLLGKNSRLGDRTPLAALRQGDRAPVMEAARTFGEHGAV